MRWIRWVFVPLAVCALISAVTGFNYTSVEGGTCASCRPCYGYGAPACAAPYFGWQPGCCELPPSPCDNAWAGYCQEKARCKAFWHRLGTGGRTCCSTQSGGCGPTAVSPKPLAQPVPTTESADPTPPGELLEAPLPPLPKPVPNEIMRTRDRSWMAPSTARR